MTDAPVRGLYPGGGVLEAPGICSHLPSGLKFPFVAQIWLSTALQSSDKFLQLRLLRLLRC